MARRRPRAPGPGDSERQPEGRRGPGLIRTGSGGPRHGLLGGAFRTVGRDCPVPVAAGAIRPRRGQSVRRSKDGPGPARPGYWLAAWAASGSGLPPGPGVRVGRCPPGPPRPQPRPQPGHRRPRPGHGASKVTGGSGLILTSMSHVDFGLPQAS